MSAKKLHQSVFEGLPSEYRWAAVDADGFAIAYPEKPHVVQGELVWSRGNLWRVLGSRHGGDSRYDATDWQNSLIERQDVPTADIDWSRQEVPAGATHYQRACATTKNTARYFKDDFSKAFVLTHPENGWIDFPKEMLTPEAYANMLVVPSKRESITDVARSIEAARVAEKVEGVINFADLVLEDPVGSLAAEYEAAMPYPDGDPRYFETSDVLKTKKYPHYFKDVSAVDAIDLYHVARLYDITDPALFHAFKKIACAGKRGAKDQAQDVQEAIDALKRWQELSV